MVVKPLRSAPTVEAQEKTILHTKAETGDSLGGVKGVTIIHAHYGRVSVLVSYLRTSERRRGYE